MKSELGRQILNHINSLAIIDEFNKFSEEEEDCCCCEDGEEELEEDE